jgi:hypothetical protein
MSPNPLGCVDWGYNGLPAYMRVVNQVARQVIEEAGFEVFDPFPASAHAISSWFDKNGKDNQHADVLGDLVVQMLLNQLCHPASHWRQTDPGRVPSLGRHSKLHLKHRT